MQADDTLQVMMRRRRAYNRHMNNSTVRSATRNLQNITAVFTAPMMSDDEEDGGVVRVPHYRAPAVCLCDLFFLLSGY